MDLKDMKIKSSEGFRPDFKASRSDFMDFRPDLGVLGRISRFSGQIPWISRRISSISGIIRRICGISDRISRIT